MDTVTEVFPRIGRVMPTNKGLVLSVKCNDRIDIGSWRLKVLSMDSNQLRVELMETQTQNETVLLVKIGTDACIQLDENTVLYPKRYHHGKQVKLQLIAPKAVKIDRLV